MTQPAETVGHRPPAIGDGERRAAQAQDGDEGGSVHVRWEADPVDHGGDEHERQQKPTDGLHGPRGDLRPVPQELPRRQEGCHRRGELGNRPHGRRDVTERERDEPEHPDQQQEHTEIRESVHREL
ncbi:hypothetical protein GALL_438860 [mine drainage metagenome]|uniref:Uncharacterized protein n=1 Tax=mine drainage metagenome TaxID=410659 RepID=A0A1J5PSJ2_9ZZZZ